MTKSKWSNKFYVTVYELARQGYKEKQIAAAIGVSLPTFTRWKAQRPALRDAWDRGTKKDDGEDIFNFHEYVFDQLPDDLRPLWQEIMAVEQDDNDRGRIEALLKDHGKRGRQHMFIYALTSSNFNISRSLARLNIPRKTFESWVRDDPQFADLLDEINWHKKNYFENALIGRVAAGDTAAILFSARTQLRDRGYNDKIDVNIQQDVNIHHTQQVNILDLDLPLEIRQGILKALRAAADDKPQQPKLIETTVVQ